MSSSKPSIIRPIVWEPGLTPEPAKDNWGGARGVNAGCASHVPYDVPADWVKLDPEKDVGVTNLGKTKNDGTKTQRWVVRTKKKFGKTQLMSTHAKFVAPSAARKRRNFSSPPFAED
jgi:hypothetical protein